MTATDTKPAGPSSDVTDEVRNRNMPVIEARRSEIHSLSNILMRAFHPTNPYIRRCHPNTPAVRQWWTQIFTMIVDDPDCHVLTCVVPEIGSPPPVTLNSDAPTHAIGVLILRWLSPTERGAGFWQAIPLTPEHDVPACDKMINGMVEVREKMMLGRAHFMIELFGVDSANQAMGIGSRMMDRACEIADEAGLEIFVQANHFARKFYEKRGFECKETKTMPGDEGYVECMLIRSVGGTRSQATLVN